MVKSFDPTIDRERFSHCASSSISKVNAAATFAPGDLWFESIGLSSKTGNAIFKKSADPRIGSRSMVDNVRDASGKFISEDSDIPVRVKTLFDLYLEYIGIPARSPKNRRPLLDILKMDIEGSEFDVILSWCSDGTHPLARQILIEFHDRMFEDGAKRRQDAYHCLKSLGYCLAYENLPKKEEVVFLFSSNPPSCD